MSIDHLTENEMQEYLEGSAGEIQKETEDHLDQCEACRIQLTAYSHVLNGFSNEPGDVFSEDLDDTVLKTIRSADPEKSIIKHTLFYLPPAAVCLSAIIACLIWSDTGSILIESVISLLNEMVYSFSALGEFFNSSDLKIEHLMIFLVFFIIYSKMDRVFFSDNSGNRNNEPTSDFQ